MKLIKETIEDIHVISEEHSGVKEYYIEGVFLQSNKHNRNGRLYPKDMLQREVTRYNQIYIQNNRAFGELGHPDSPAINLDRVSHMIVDLREDQNDFIGKAKILDTPFGKIVKNFLDAGAKLGVSSRGVGNLKENGNGIKIVQDDFHLATAADIVADPSAPDAFVRGIMEGSEWLMNPIGEWVEVDYEAAKKAIKEASKADLGAIKLKVFENFIRKL